jgi:hypothetical protein
MLRNRLLPLDRPELPLNTCGICHVPSARVAKDRVKIWEKTGKESSGRPRSSGARREILRKSLDAR